MLMLGKGEWNGKALWRLVVLEDPRGDSDWAGRCEWVHRLLSTKGRSSGAVLSFSIMHILHASSC